MKNLNLLARAQGTIARVKVELIKHPVPWNVPDPRWELNKISDEIDNIAEKLGKIRLLQKEQNTRTDK